MTWLSAKSWTNRHRLAIVAVLAAFYLGWLIGSIVYSHGHVRPPIWEQVLFAIGAGVVASALYAMIYGAAIERKRLEALANRVSADAINETKAVLADQFDLLPIRTFKTKGTTRGELTRDYGAFWNHEIEQSGHFHFRGEYGQIAIYRLTNLKDRLSVTPMRLTFLLLNPWRTRHTPEASEIEHLLVSLHALRKLACHRAFTRIEVGLTEGPLTYRVEIADAMCMLSYFNDHSEDPNYYAYRSKTPTYVAHRRWLLEELEYSKKHDGAFSISDHDALQTAVDGLTGKLTSGLVNELGKWKAGDLENALNSRHQRFEQQRANILA